MVKWARLLWLILLSTAFFVGIVVGGTLALVVGVLIAKHYGLGWGLAWVLFVLGCVVGFAQWRDEIKYGR